MWVLICITRLWSMWLNVQLIYNLSIVKILSRYNMLEQWKILFPKKCPWIIVVFCNSFTYVHVLRRLKFIWVTIYLVNDLVVSFIAVRSIYYFTLCCHFSYIFKIFIYLYTSYIIHLSNLFSCFLYVSHNLNYSINLNLNVFLFFFVYGS